MRKSEFCQRLGLDAPIVQAPMASSTTPELVAAVSNAGGLGSHGCASFAPDRLGEEIAAIRARTNRGFNLNFFTHRAPVGDTAKEEAMRALLAPYHAALGLGDVPGARDTMAPFGRDQLDVLLADPPQVVSFHFGLPAPALVRPLQERGTVVLSSATTVAEARWLAERGVDAIIAQGGEAGGHRGTFLTEDYGAALVGTIALVPQVVDAVDVPVIAAGGIADGRGLAAALVLGAEAAQLGTAFLTTDEAGTNALYRDALAGASGEGTVVTKTFSGRPARGLRNRYVEEMSPHEDTLPDFPLAYSMNAALRAEAAARGDAGLVAHWSGQAVALNRRLSAAELVTRIMAEARALLPAAGGGA